MTRAPRPVPLRRAGDGAPAAAVGAGLPPFDQLVTDHGAVVLRVCRAVCGPIEAEDAWSETFLSALEAYPRLEQGAVVLKTAKDLKTARAFLDYVKSPEGTAVFKRYGFFLPDKASAEKGRTQ